MFNTILFVLFLIVAALPSQSPPTVNWWSVGLLNAHQPYSGWGTIHAGEQRIDARVASFNNDATANVLVGNYGIRIGRRLWWATAAIAVVPAAPAFPQWHASGATPATVFGLSTVNGLTQFSMPGGATGFDQVFVPTVGSIVIFNPAVVTTTTNQTALGLGFGGVVPPAGTDVYWLYWDVPNDPALVGYVISMQTARIEPLNGLWYLSDQHITQIGS